MVLFWAWEQRALSAATLLPVLSSQGEQHPKPGSVQVCRVRNSPECGALGCAGGVCCAHTGDGSGSQLISHMTGGLRASQLDWELWVQDKHVQSNPSPMWAADLPSWMRTVPTTFVSSSPFCIGVAARVSHLWLQPLSTPGPQTRKAQTLHLPSQQAKYEECSCTDECCR